MPIIKSAKKAARQAEKRTELNNEIKKAIKIAIKDFKKNPSMATLAKAQSELDKAVKKDLLKKNTVARKKAKLHKIAKAANVKLVKVEKKVAKTVAKGAKKVETAAKKVETKAKKVATKKTQSKATAKKK